MIKRILKVPSQRLRLISEPVKNNEDISGLIKDLKDTLVTEGYIGLGLSAPQINVRKQVILVKVLHSATSDPIPTILINPVIIKEEGKIVTRESCLSVPGVSGKVERSQYITVEFLNEEGIESKAIFQTEEAVLVQHEIDHTLGILFTDKVI